MGKLLPCPFCGYKEPVSDLGSACGHAEIGFVECCGGGCGVIVLAKTEAKAIKMWNTRTPSFKWINQKGAPE